MTNLHALDKSSWLETVWEALFAFREDCIPESDSTYDDQWNDITSAMAWIEEELTTDRDSIDITWHIEDIQQQRADLNDEQARRVLQALKAHHDAGIGINWDVIDCATGELFPES